MPDMNLPLPPPSLEPTLYFFSNSLAVVGAAALVFFILGLWFGYLTWGRYKRRSRAFMEETNLLRHEIARLKRRIAEEAVAPTLTTPEEEPTEIQPMLFLLEEPVVSIPPEEPALPVVAVSPEPPTMPEALPQPVVEPEPAAVPVVNVEPVINTIVPGELMPPDAEPKKETLTLPKPLPEVVPSVIANVAAEAPALEPVQAPPLVTPQEPEPTPEETPAAADEPPVLISPAVVANELAGRLFASELANGSVTVDARLGIRYAERPDRWDDLTLMRGVAEITQQKLHDCGIFTFKQIAVWDDHNSREVGHDTHTGERITRERWVQQARDLHYLKYGEKLV